MIELPLKIAALLANFERPWFFAGGWALDLFLGRVTREHADIEIGLFRSDQLAIQTYLSGWQFSKVINKQSRIEPWLPSEILELPNHEVYAENPTHDPPKLEILLNEATKTDWLFRKNLAITRPLSLTILASANGLSILSPEIVLLYKAANPRPKDEADFSFFHDKLNKEQQVWLHDALTTCYPGHKWLGTI